MSHLRLESYIVPIPVSHPSIVLGFACTSGAANTCLYANALTLDCGGANVWTLDPSQGPGRITENSPLLYGAAV